MTQRSFLVGDLSDGDYQSAPSQSKPNMCVHCTYHSIWKAMKENVWLVNNGLSRFEKHETG